MDARTYDHTERKIELVPALQIKNVPDDLWIGSILLYINNLADLGHLAKTSKAARAVVFQYLENQVKLLNALIEYTNAIDRIAFIDSQKDNIALISTTANARRASSQDIEDKRPVKKSTMARILSFVPGMTLLSNGIPKLVAADKARTAAKIAIDTLLAPTCNFPMWHDSDGTPILYNIVRSCGYKAPDTDLNVCDSWSSPSTGTLCSKAICEAICSSLYESSAINDWNGGWLIATGIASLIIAGFLFNRLGKLSHVSLEKILSQSFTKIFDDDFQKIVGCSLKKDKSQLDKLTVGAALQELNELEEIAIQKKNKLLCSVPIKNLQQTLFFKLDPKLRETSEAHVVDIKENSASESEDRSLTTPLITQH